MIEAALQMLDMRLQVSVFKSYPEVLVVGLSGGVEIEADVAREQDRILRNNGQPGIMKTFRPIQIRIRSEIRIWTSTVINFFFVKLQT